jgi:hypothetical protein
MPGLDYNNLKDKSKMEIFCNSCGSYTTHFCEYEISNRIIIYQDDEGNSESEEISNSVWICAGCQTVTLLVRTQNPYFDKSYIEFFPKRLENDYKGKVFIQIPTKLKILYREVISALNNNQRILCAGGIRALLEGICFDKEVKGENLKESVDNLVQFIPKGILDNLHSIRFIGNDALHDLEQPNRDTLELAIDIVEDILNFLYELDYKANQLAQKRYASQKGAFYIDFNKILDKPNET